MINGSKAEANPGEMLILWQQFTYFFLKKTTW